MGGFVARAIACGVEAIAFGDLYLEDIRAYRESLSRRHGPRAALSALGPRHGPLAER